MTDDKYPANNTPSTETTGESPVVPQTAALNGATVMIRQDGSAELNSTEPHIISARNMEKKLQDPNKVVARLVGRDCHICSPPYRCWFRNQHGGNRTDSHVQPASRSALW